MSPTALSNFMFPSTGDLGNEVQNGAIVATFPGTYTPTMAAQSCANAAESQQFNIYYSDSSSTWTCASAFTDGTDLTVYNADVSQSYLYVLS